MAVDSKIRFDPLTTVGLDDKIALVTGGTRGIGRGIVLALAAAGAKVVVTGRGQANGEEVISETRKHGREGGFIAADLFDDDSVDNLVNKTIQQFGGLDILVNNAGIDADAPVLNYELETWRRVLRFNLEVPFRLSQHAAQHMVAHGGGSIINIASVLGFVGVNEGCSYSAAKHGLIGMTKGMAIEWSKQGVRVNAVAPGLIQTDMTANLWQADFGEAYVQSRIPQGRIGQPADIGGAVVFLASPAADFVHGQTIAVDGGFLAT